MEWLSNFLNNILNSLSEPDGSFNFIQIISAGAIAYLGGILSSLTPCVYPMIPITISVIGGTTSKDKSTRDYRWKDLALRSLVYVTGMAFVYAFLGVIAGITGKVFGTLTIRGGWYLMLGTVYAIGALMMLNIIHFDPIVLLDRLSRSKVKKNSPLPKNREINLLGIFALGASSGFIASPCTTPVLTAILAFIANTQSVALGLILMLGFALGIGTLLLLIAFFTGAIQYLPKSGVWMEKVKLGSGILMLIVSHYMLFKSGKIW